MSKTIDSCGYICCPSSGAKNSAIGLQERGFRYRSDLTGACSLAGHVRTFDAWAAVVVRRSARQRSAAIVMPGLAAGDSRPRRCADLPRRAGYRPMAGGLSVNVGRSTERVLSGLASDGGGVGAEFRPTRLVGRVEPRWCMFARLGSAFPDSVSQVITMGSPFRYRYQEICAGLYRINQLLGLQCATQRR